MPKRQTSHRDPGGRKPWINKETYSRRRTIGMDDRTCVCGARGIRSNSSGIEAEAPNRPTQRASCVLGREGEREMGGGHWTTVGIARRATKLTLVLDIIGRCPESRNASL